MRADPPRSATSLQAATARSDPSNAITGLRLLATFGVNALSFHVPSAAAASAVVMSPPTSQIARKLSCESAATRGALGLVTPSGTSSVPPALLVVALVH